jgi:hypothetical protein
VEQKQYADAAAHFTQALAINPQHPSAQRSLQNLAVDQRGALQPPESSP